LAATLWMASAAPVTATPAAAVAVSAPPQSVAGEPLFADIVKRAEALKTEVDGWKGKAGPLPGFDAFAARVAELSGLDMQAHLLLAKRGTDGDLKCILRGISQDLPVRLKEVETAADQRSRDMALKEMFWLLRDNVEVITTPPTATSGT
ncbi:MAG TPA: hypothetical protein PLO65_16580, partial [Caulobacter sp.]|nr:hypothetical protein [Caulobacter sp.]